MPIALPDTRLEAVVPTTIGEFRDVLA